jgi:hypothetical protein
MSWILQTPIFLKISNIFVNKSSNTMDFGGVNFSLSKQMPWFDRTSTLNKAKFYIANEKYQADTNKLGNLRNEL